MREVDRDSREIIEILADVVRETAVGCVLEVPDDNYGSIPIECPEINYTFGNAQYVKDRLDELSQTPEGEAMKFPLIALFCPFTEQRNSNDYHAKAKVHILIACQSSKEWSNEQRRVTSFANILRPIYRSFLKALLKDRRLDFGYKRVIAHEYSENYSFGRYGAHTGTGDAVSEPIDAINITNLELTIKNQNCRQQ